MKRIVFPIIASLLVIGLVLPGCSEEAGPTIDIAIAGPMEYIQSKHMMYGAEMAAEEINDAGGVNVGGTYHKIKLIEVDTNEIDKPEDAGPALENAITVKGAQFVIGGFNTTAVEDMIAVAIENETLFFICGAASYTLLAAASIDPGYKYIFRGTPFNDFFLANNAFMMLGMVAEAVADLGVSPVKIAIFAESLPWADSMVTSAQTIIGGDLGTALGWTLAGTGPDGPGTWRVTDKQDATTVSDYLNQIKDAGANIIFTILSGPVGVTYSKLRGALEVPAISVGVNVEAQYPDFWQKTKWATGKYGAEYEITTGTWAPGVFQTGTTAPFLAAFQAYTGGLFPVYTAASYDMVYTLKDAIAAVGLDTDALIAWLENPANARPTSTGKAAYYPRWDGVTGGDWEGANLPALNSSQVDTFYRTIGYANSCNFAMPPYTTHDLVYGPGWLTGIAVQWQQGDIVGVWPKAEYDGISNELSRIVSGLSWTDVEYEGTEHFIIPDWMVDVWLP